MLANSVPSNGYYKYQRVYNPNTAVLFSQIVGYDSIIYGKTGIEAQYNSYLESHTRPAKTLRDLLVNRTTTGNVTLTISSTLQSQVAQAVDNTDVNGSAPQAGAVVMNVKTGAIEAMYSNPTFDPSPLVSPNIAAEKYAWAALNPNSAQSPLVSRTFQYGFLPGSTFKTVTSAAVYDHQPALAKLDVPVTGCISLEPQSNLPLCNYGHNGPSGPEHCGGVITVTLPQSCDTAFATLGMDLGGARSPRRHRPSGSTRTSRSTSRARACRNSRRAPASTSTNRPRPIRRSVSRMSWRRHSRWRWWPTGSPIGVWS